MIGPILSALAPIVGVPVVGVIPPSRPDRFVTVERTGGDATRFMDFGQYAVQAWAPTVLEAESLMDETRAAVWQLCRQPWVAGVEVGSCYNFPDPEGRHNRYQCVCEITTMHDLADEKEYTDGEANEK